MIVILSTTYKLKKVNAAMGNNRGSAKPKVKVTNTVFRMVAYLK